MDGDALLAHRNHMAVLARAPEADYTEGTLLFAGPNAFPLLNGVMREPGAGDAQELLERAAEFFGRRERGWEAYVPAGLDDELDAAVRAAGLELVLERYPEMACRAPVPEPDADLRPVTTEDQAEAYWAICSEAYRALGFPRDAFAGFGGLEALQGEDLAACLAYVDGEPVATAMVTLALGAAMVGWVAARRGFQRRGLATACTAWATNRAFERGARLVTLQASRMGEGLYERMGYEELFSYTLYGAEAPG